MSGHSTILIAALVLAAGCAPAARAPVGVDPAAQFVEGPSELEELVREAGELDALPYFGGTVLVILRLPPWGGRRVVVAYGEQRRTVPLDGAGRGAVAFDETDVGFLHVQPRVDEEGDAGREICRYPSELVQAGVLEVSFAFAETEEQQSPGEIRGEGRFFQWPAVTWTAVRQAAMSMVPMLHLNGRRISSTPVTLLVRPHRRHRAAWLSTDGSIICGMELLLPAAVRRTYACDVASAEITER